MVDIADAEQLRAELDRIRAALRILLAPPDLGKGALRLEHWNEWPEEQRRAYDELKHRVGALSKSRTQLKKHVNGPRARRS